MHKKLLILQFRTGVAKEHEQQCFLEDLSHIADQLEFRDAIVGDFPEDVSMYSGMIVGGSGEFLLGEGHGEGSWKNNTFAFFDRVIDADIPVLGICLGFQLLALHQGARIVNHESMREVGSFDVYQLAHAIDDPLFQDMPKKFVGQFGHKETIVDAPEHLIPLAYTDRVELNTFRVQGKKIWGTLLHPELDKKRIEYRVRLFPSYASGQTLDQMFDQLLPSPHAPILVENFIKMLD